MKEGATVYRRIDLTGKKYNKLLVLGFSCVKNGNSMWNCKCDCGNTSVVRSSNLTKGRIKSCGCSNIEDLTGKRFGKLTVIEQAAKRGGRICWKCKCDCGNEIEVVAHQLKSGKTKSCGCYQRELRFDDLTNKRFNNLTVIEYMGKNKHNASLWKCKCDCGKEIITQGQVLKKSEIISCSYCRKERKREAQKKMLDIREDKKVEGVYVPALKKRKENGTTSKYKGVYYNSRECKWKAYITLKYKKVFLGTYSTEEEAYKVRKIAEEILHEPFITCYENGIEAEELKQRIQKALETIKAS